MGPILPIRPLQNLVRVGIQMNVRVFAEADKGKVVLVNVAQNPDVREVGDRERIRRRQTLRPGGGSHLLVGDDAGGGGADIDNRRRMMDVCAQDAKVIQRGFNGDLGLGFGILGNLKIVQRDRAMFVQSLSSGRVACAPKFRPPPPAGNRKMPAKCPGFVRASGVALYSRCRPGGREYPGCAPRRAKPPGCFVKRQG